MATMPSFREGTFALQLHATDPSFQRKLESSVLHALQVTGWFASLSPSGPSFGCSPRCALRPAFAGMTNVLAIHRAAVALRRHDNSVFQ